MIKAEISLTNMDGFDAQLAEVVVAVEANLKEVASLVYSEAKGTAAFADKTGNLRKSIRLQKSKYIDGGYIVRASGRNLGGGDGDKGYHAHLIEFGHSMWAWGNRTGKRVDAHPFMRPAKEKGIRKAIDLFRSGKK